MNKSIAGKTEKLHKRKTAWLKHRIEEAQAALADAENSYSQMLNLCKKGRVPEAILRRVEDHILYPEPGPDWWERGVYRRLCEAYGLPPLRYAAKEKGYAYDADDLSRLLSRINRNPEAFDENAMQEIIDQRDLTQTNLNILADRILFLLKPGTSSRLELRDVVNAHRSLESQLDRLNVDIEIEQVIRFQLAWAIKRKLQRALDDAKFNLAEEG